MKDVFKVRWLDGSLIVALTAFAVWRFWWPPQLAVSKLQESPKFTVAAWYLYKTGHYEWFINHQPYPAEGSVGYGLLLVPSFWLFGDFLGNAIYSQLALGVLTCLGVYAALRSCFGRWQGFVAGIVLASYPGFGEYCRMADTSIAQAFLVMAALLLFLKMTADVRWPSMARWFLWGLCAGWAASVRLDTLAMFGLFTLALICFVRPRRTNLVKHLGVATLAAFGPVSYAGWYNQHYCGSWLRDPHCFWHSRQWEGGWRAFDIHRVFGAINTQENADRGNLIFYGREILDQFSNWPNLSQATKQTFVIPCFCLTALMIVGIGYAWRQRRQSEAKLRFLTFVAIVAGTAPLFYLFLPVHVARYAVPMAPGVASLVGVGAVGIARSFCRGLRTRILGALVGLALVLASRHWISFIPIRIGDSLPVVPVLQHSAACIESNAVVISTAGPCLTDFFMIRGTQRTFVPPDHRTLWRIQPRPPKNRAIIPPLAGPDTSYPGDLENGAVDIFEFSALENPDRIDRLLLQGIPVYFVDHTLGTACSELPRLLRRFELSPVGAAKFELKGVRGFAHTGPCLWQLHSRLMPAGRSSTELAEADYNAGIALMRQRRFSEAVEVFDYVLRLKPDFAGAHNNLGVALEQLGRVQEAVAQFEQATNLSPDDADAHNNLGAALILVGRLPEAVDQLTLAVRLKPDDAEAHCNLGIALERAGKIDDAIRHFDQALQIDPNYAEARNRLSRLRTAR
jgi:4-amino-4-deoxy-L-arabinose transferase-like glycosyltransferase